MNNIHQNAIKYITHLVLNKGKLDNKQALVRPPHPNTYIDKALTVTLDIPPLSPTIRKNGITPYTCIIVACDQNKANGLVFTVV